MHADPTPDSTSGYRYFLHAWREEPSSGLYRCNELYATDGERVRILRSRGSHLTYEYREEPSAARKVVDTIEAQWEPGSSLIGFESLADSRRVAILRRGRDGEDQWAAFRCKPQAFPSEIAVEPADLEPTGRRIHIVGGAERGWRHGAPVVQGALEVRSWGDRSIGEVEWLLEELESVELRATAERRGTMEEIGLVPAPERRREPMRAREGRVEFEFPIDEVIDRNYRERPSFQPWFALEISSELLEIPEMWRTFWMTVALGEASQ